jgi:hypothetical protein
VGKRRTSETTHSGGALAVAMPLRTRMMKRNATSPIIAMPGTICVLVWAWHLGSSWTCTIERDAAFVVSTKTLVFMDAEGAVRQPGMPSVPQC